MLLCANQPIVVNINGTEVVRNITVIKDSDNYSHGKVGKANFFWNSKQFSLPIVYIDGRKYTGDLVCKQVAFFLKSWVKEVTKPRHTQLCYTIHDARKAALETAAKKDGSYISGHPLWLTNIKNPVKCYSRTTGEFLYKRRAVIPLNMKDIAEKYVPDYCSQCQYRACCTAPCLDPIVKSAEQVIAC